jgi:hypothetical protein
MAEFLTTHATASQIENIILDAKEKLVLVSPYLQVSKTFMDRLIDADESGTKILVIYGKDELKTGERDQLNRLKNLSLLYCENLHAKCYFNENTMVITSMNMYEFSEKTNREMGVLIDRVSDVNLYEKAVREIQSIERASVKPEDKISQQYHQVTVENAPKIPTPKPTSAKQDFVHKKPEFSILGEIGKALGLSEKKGYCIRGGETIPLDVTHPLCGKHFAVWKEHSDPEYKEKYCHICGQHHKTSFSKPLCLSCFKKSVS